MPNVMISSEIGKGWGGVGLVALWEVGWGVGGGGLLLGTSHAVLCA